jgi:hypothetical protein
MQQGLGRNAPPVEADTTGILFGIDQDHLHSQICAHEGGCVSAGPAADDNQFNAIFDHGFSLLFITDEA